MGEVGATPAAQSGEREEQTLLAGLRSGEERAYETLVRSHLPRLLPVARHLLGNEDDAMDAVQEAFFSAFRSLASFEGQSRLSTWLHRIVVNACIMKLRKRKSRKEVAIEDLLPRFLDDGHQAEFAVAWVREVEPEIERDETRERVRTCIDRLPAAYRTVILLRDIEGLDTTETARQLEISKESVKVRLHRARQALRTLLDPYFREAQA